jgi:hypothetical protein
MLTQIIENQTNWPEEVVTLAKELHGMNAVYASYAANFSQKLFMQQQKLGLDPSDVIAAITEVASIVGIVEQNSDNAIKIIISNQPAPELGNLPKEDA